MGLVKLLGEAAGAVGGAIEGALSDQFLEVIESGPMGAQTAFAAGVRIKRGGRREDAEGIVTDGSVIHVYDNQFMVLVDGGKIIGCSAVPGYFKVENSAAPSFFLGDMDRVIEEGISRLQHGGAPSTRQQVFFINLQEISGLKFGTRNAVNYFDAFYGAELFLRAHGTYSIKIVDPLKFYQECVPRNARSLEADQVGEQWLNEFLEALQSAINQMSADGVRISHVSSKSRELGAYMSRTLDDSWRSMRGVEVQSVGVASISYDPESQKLINMRNQGAMLSDPAIRAGYVEGAVARGVEAAGSNAQGAVTGFLGAGLGMQVGGVVGPWGARPAAKKNDGWDCACGGHNADGAKFCPECGAPRPSAPSARFCVNGHRIENPKAKFCPECGTPL